MTQENQWNQPVHSKKPGEKPSRKEIHYSKEKFQIYYKTFVPRLYNSRRWTYSRNLLSLQNLWTLQYMNATLFVAQIPVRD